MEQRYLVMLSNALVEDRKKMTVFTLIYGLIYFGIWLFVYNLLKNHLSGWIAGFAGVVVVLLFRYFLIWSGEVSMRRHQRKKGIEEMEKNISSREDV
ncbi:hypothetical protein IB269_15330 [Delftia sp. DLF01]|uniref:hypothetical protein n=1 Tax=Delftia sp. DLF01 TaxID=2769279 RepID=UPI00177AD5B8|nr:hypothetical protein [Delftia sp. DLF01]MBD9582762.1 hypothetical protein [Delftia sp. DLF01]